MAGGRNDGGGNIDEATYNLFHKLRGELLKAPIVAIQPIWEIPTYGKVIRNSSRLWGGVRENWEAVSWPRRAGTGTWSASDA